MDKPDLIRLLSNYVESSADNCITKETAISEDVAGMKIFEVPVVAFGDAGDEYFELLKDPSVIGSHFMAPQEWLPQSKTVISFFLPFTEAVKKGNRKDMSWPSKEWLHGRIEGQAFINKLCLYLKTELINEGYNTVAPSLDERFFSKSSTKRNPLHSKNMRNGLSFTSNWSERHAAFVCGLGTFGLSKGIITKKGMAGRFGSVITEFYIPPDKREYEDIYEYCSMCGACAKNCPVNAIEIDKGKNHVICCDFLDLTSEKFQPRYGCGKCQVKVPCESGIPKKMGEPRDRVK